MEAAEGEDVPVEEIVETQEEAEAAPADTAEEK